MRENGVLVVPNGKECVDLTVGTSVTPLDPREHPAHEYRRAVVQANGTLRWTASEDHPPTATFGMYLREGDTLVYDGDLDSLRFVRDSTQPSDVTVFIHYFGL